MTDFATLYSKHRDNSRARRVLGHYRDAINVLEQAAIRIREEGDAVWAARIAAHADMLLEQAEHHMRAQGGSAP